jgi:uncharacterized protein YbjT (DUF2867 family)
MVGQGVLRECLADPDVESVLSIGRSPSGPADRAAAQTRFREIVHADLWHYESIEAQLSGFDACFFCLGVSVAGMTEAAYTRVTHDLTLAAATTLVRLNPSMTFIYISGASTDSSEQGKTMWARVKGKTENALLRLPFKAKYMFRPGVIQSVHGERSKTPAYRVTYLFLNPLLPLLRRLFPDYVTTTEHIGRAMLRVTKHGHATPIVENRDINSVGHSADDRSPER